MMNIVEISDKQHYLTRLKSRQESGLKKVWGLLDKVCDPEIPVLSLWDLGVLTQVEQQSNEITAYITPTYSGCPAVEVMRDDIVSTLTENGYKNVKVKTRLSPAWSSTWLSPNGHKKLADYGIAPPNRDYCAQKTTSGNIAMNLACPRCYSLNTKELSEFGSTACKAMHQCIDCLEPFDYFKVI